MIVAVRFFETAMNAKNARWALRKTLFYSFAVVASSWRPLRFVFSTAMNTKDAGRKEREKEKRNKKRRNEIRIKEKRKIH